MLHDLRLKVLEAGHVMSRPVRVVVQAHPWACYAIIAFVAQSTQHNTRGLTAKRGEAFSTFLAKTFLTKPSHEQLSYLKEMAILERCICANNSCQTKHIFWSLN